VWGGVKTQKDLKKKNHPRLGGKKESKLIGGGTVLQGGRPEGECLGAKKENWADKTERKRIKPWGTTKRNKEGKRGQGVKSRADAWTLRLTVTGGKEGSQKKEEEGEGVGGRKKKKKNSRKIEKRGLLARNGRPRTDGKTTRAKDGKQRGGVHHVGRGNRPCAIKHGIEDQKQRVVPS